MLPSFQIGHQLVQGAGKIIDSYKGTKHKPRNTAGDLRKSPYFKFAAMASAAYEEDKKSKLGKLETHLGKKHGWVLNDTYSHRKTSVFHNHETKEAVVAFRGTKCEKGVFDCLTGDLGTDIALAVGMEAKTGRFTKSLKEFDEIKKFYDSLGYKVSTTGHSLGGSLARYVHQERPQDVKEAHMFNPGTALGQDLHLADGAFSHHVANDPVSMLGISEDPHVLVYDSLTDNNNIVDNHYMKNFF